MARDQMSPANQILESLKKREFPQISIHHRLYFPYLIHYSYIPCEYSPAYSPSPPSRGIPLLSVDAGICKGPVRTHNCLRSRLRWRRLKAQEEDWGADRNPPRWAATDLCRKGVGGRLQALFLQRPEYVYDHIGDQTSRRILSVPGSPSFQL